MSKDTFGDWSTTAGNNTDVGGINIAEGMATASVNNAMREIMAQLASWLGGDDGSQFEGVDLGSLGGQYPSTGTEVHVMRATTGNPIGSNGHLVLQGDPTNGGRIYFVTGTNPSAKFIVGLSSLVSKLQVLLPAGTVGAPSIAAEDDDNTGLNFPGSNVITISAGGSQTAKADDTGFYVGAAGHLNPAVAEYGVTMTKAGALHLKRSGGQPMNIGRSDDGSIISFQSGQTTQGVISVSGSTVTYGTFCGAHWSQFHSFARPNILPGTILETIPEMCIWPGEDGADAPDDVLPRVQIATPGSRAVYGVFGCWDMIDNDDGTQTPSRDCWVNALGAWKIRIASGESVTTGDLIEAGSDGCGVVQADDIVRSSTVAKITSTVSSQTYDDGSFLLPCTLHCG